MRLEDALFCRDKARVITVNSTWRLATWADAHYSSDADWWALELPEMRAACEGQFWTGHAAGIAPDVHVMPYDKEARGLSKAPDRIAWGGNSGYCAIGLAVQFGASRIALLGYDMQDDGRAHWHGQHAASVRKAFNFPMWRQRFAEMAIDADRRGIEIVNCSRETALTCFPRAKLEDVL